MKRMAKFPVMMAVVFLLMPLFVLADGRADSAPDVVDPLTPYTSDRLYADVQALVERYPEALSLSSIGQSVLGKDIPLLKLGRGARPVLWVGAMHSREVVTTAFLMLTAEEYAAAWYGGTPYGAYPAEKVRWLLDEFTVYIVPMVNPDGVDIVTAGGPATVHIQNPGAWKSNANGVNLNRNFPFDWDKNRDGGDSNNYLSYKGPSAGSEPETQALMALCESVAFEHMVSCHCQGKVMYWRDDGNGEVPGDRALARTISDITGYAMLPSTSSALNGWGGGFENWFRYQYNRPGICLEFCRFNTADPETMSKFYTSDMVNWPQSQNLLLGVLDSLSDMAAKPTRSTVRVNGEALTFDAYNIGGSNYFKLRDLAFVLSGTAKQFEVAWDAGIQTIFLYSGYPYTPVGGEMAVPGTQNAPPVPTSARICLDGREVALTAYNIGGNNYFKLRDIGQALDFGVDWDAEGNTVLIDTSQGYMPD